MICTNWQQANKEQKKYFHLGRENQDGKNILIYFLCRNIWIDNTITSLLIISLDTGLYIVDTGLLSCQGDTSSCTRPCRLCSTCTGRRCRHPCKENIDMKWVFFNSLFVPILILSRYVLRYLFQCKVIVKPLNRDWFFLHMYKIYISVRIYLKILQFVCCFLESIIWFLACDVL